MIDHDIIYINEYPSICPLNMRQPYDKKLPEVEWIHCTAPIIKGARGDVCGAFIAGHRSIIKCPECGATTDDRPPLDDSLVKEIKEKLKEKFEKS